MERAAGAIGVGVVVGAGATGGRAGHMTMTPAPMMRAGSALAPPAVAQGGQTIQGPTIPARMAAVVRDVAALALLGWAVGARLLRATSGSDFLGK